jgi:hypothetical protein
MSGVRRNRGIGQVKINKNSEYLWEIGKLRFPTLLFHWGAFADAGKILLFKTLLPVTKTRLSWMFERRLEGGYAAWHDVELPLTELQNQRRIPCPRKKFLQLRTAVGNIKFLER